MAVNSVQTGLTTLQLPLSTRDDGLLISQSAHRVSESNIRRSQTSPPRRPDNSVLQPKEDGPGSSVSLNVQTDISSAVKGESSSGIAISVYDRPNIPTAASSETLRNDPPKPAREPDPFREPRELPRTRKNTFYVYPHSGSVITPDHICRFPVVVEMFKRNVENDAKLKPHVLGIDYTLRMCGPSPADSHPSIVVFCVESAFYDLQKLLTSRHLTEQYYLPKSPHPLSMLGILRNNSMQSLGRSHLPRFKIYFWRTCAVPRVLLGKGNIIGEVDILKQEDTSIAPFSTLTMCGSRVTFYDGTCATIACLLEVDDVLYALTVSHTFAHLVKQVQSDVDASTAECDSEDGEFMVDDVEYESCDEGDTTNKPRQVPQGAKGVQTSTILHFQCSSTSENPDLDWALVAIHDEEERKPNFYIPPDNSKPVFLRRVAHRHPGVETEVFVISAGLVARRGVLLAGNSFVGGITRPGMCEVWSVTCPEGPGLSPGDSGSLVVDAATSEMYGYVVALSPLGELYIVPLVTTLCQISEVLGTCNLALPDPALLSQGMMARRSISDQTVYPLVELTYLCAVLSAEATSTRNEPSHLKPALKKEHRSRTPSDSSISNDSWDEFPPAMGRLQPNPSICLLLQTTIRVAHPGDP